MAVKHLLKLLWREVILSGKCLILGLDKVFLLAVS